MSQARKPPIALTIAGSDSGGGAGIQADLKTFAAHGVYGASALTAVTAQNTRRVSGVATLSAEILGLQIDAVATDLGVDAAKTGMLASRELIETAAKKLAEHRIDKVVVDPVMVAKSGDRLLEPEAVAAVRDVLVPRAYVVTPNLPEASAIVEFEVSDTDKSVQAAARRIVEMGARAVVVKGGHGSGDESVDWLYDGRRFTKFAAPRLSTRNTHGTGCTFSAAIAARLALGEDLETAVGAAKRYLSQALAAGASAALGSGHGPVDHFLGRAVWPPAG